MTDQDESREQVDEAQEDIELSEDQSEEIKGGATAAQSDSAGYDFGGNKKL
jgi:hypothetical protein